MPEFFDTLKHLGVMNLLVGNSVENKPSSRQQVPLSAVTIDSKWHDDIVSLRGQMEKESATNVNLLESLIVSIS